MRPLRTWDEVSAVAAAARGAGFFTTNFFPDRTRMAEWCRDGSFFVESGGETRFFVRRQEGFCNLYFMSGSAEALAADLNGFVGIAPECRIVADLVGPDRIRKPLEAAFASAGFMPLTTLRRMSRKTPQDAGTNPAPVSPEVEHAGVSDAEAVKALLDSHFVAEEEQLPSVEEIMRWVDAGTLYIVRGDTGNPLRGFTAFDLSPAALYLRYWFVHPSARGAGVGGMMLRAMFAAGCGTRRQYFWVKADNENAIARYRHYGFEFEPMEDVVMGLAMKR